MKMIFLFGSILLGLSRCNKDPVIHGLAITTDVGISVKKANVDLLNPKNPEAYDLTKIRFESSQDPGTLYSLDLTNSDNIINLPRYYKGENGVYYLSIFPVIGNVPLREEERISVYWPDGSKDELIFKILKERYRIFLSDFYINGTSVWHEEQQSRDFEILK